MTLGDFSLKGTVNRAKVIKVSDDCYRVKLLPQKCIVTLPFDHLSDYPEIQELFKLGLTKGDYVQKVTPFNRNQKGTVSRKECLVRAAEGKKFMESFNDLKKGMLLPAVVKNHQDFGFFVELAGGYTGLCPATSLPTIEKSALKDHFPEGRSVLARIKKIGNAKGRFLVSVATQDCWHDPIQSITDYLQSRDEAFRLLAKNDDKLENYCNMEVGSIVEVTIKSVTKKKVVCESSSGLQAFATHEHLGSLKPEIGKRYSSVVLDVDITSPCLQVTLDPKLCKAIKSSGKNTFSEKEVGQSLNADILLVKKGFILLKVNSHGCIKLMYMSGAKHFNAINQVSRFKVGMSSKVLIKGKVDGHLIGVMEEKQADDIKVGDVVDAVVEAVNPLEMLVDIQGVLGRVHITEMADDVKEGKIPFDDFTVGASLKVKVIAKAVKNKMNKSKPEELMSEELLTSRGAKMLVFVKSVDSSKVMVLASLMHFGSISLFHLSNDIHVLNEAASRFKVGQALKATVIGKTEEDQLVFSLTGENKEPEVGIQIVALISEADKSKPLSLQLSNGSKGSAEWPKGASSQYTKGSYVKCEVLSLSKNGDYTLTVIRTKRKATAMTEEEDTDIKTKKRKKGSQESETSDLDISVNENSTKKRKKERQASQSSGDENSRMEISAKTMKRKKERQNSQTSESSGTESESEEETTPAAKKSKRNPVDKDSSSKTNTNTTNKKHHGKERLTIEGFAWGAGLSVQQKKTDDSDGDDDDDDVDDAKRKPVKTDSKLKKKEMRREEKMIDEYEKQQLRGNTGPQTVNDFERLVLQSPNSSMVWLGYMAHHLELGEIAKARTVAEKALDTIGFREEQEKKNVWLAYLNLEVMYGESEDLKKLLQRAITYNDPFEIQLKMCDIYIGANKMEEAELQFQVLIRKFKKEKSVWKTYAQFLYTQNKQAAARNILKKGLTTLEKRDHVEVITRFACLEFSHGNPERGRTLFENLIASYPQRTDIWSVYIDIVVKSGDIDGARQLLERGVQQKLNPKKISFLIKKYIRFEETHGTEDQVHKVKDLAVSLFQSEK